MIYLWFCRYWQIANPFLGGILWLIKADICWRCTALRLPKRLRFQSIFLINRPYVPRLWDPFLMEIQDPKRVELLFGVYSHGCDFVWNGFLLPFCLLGIWTFYIGQSKNIYPNWSDVRFRRGEEKDIAAVLSVCKHLFRLLQNNPPNEPSKRKQILCRLTGISALILVLNTFHSQAKRPQYPFSVLLWVALGNFQKVQTF